MKSFAFHNQIIPILPGIVFLLTCCQSDIQYMDKKPEEMVISQYIESNPDFTEFNNILEAAGLKSCLSVRGPYTLFLPDNKAMLAYYKLKNANSFTDFSKLFQNELIRNHIVGFEIPTNEIGLGALKETNAIGDYLVSEFEGTDIIISKYSKIIKRNIRTSNGYIHVVDRVLDPVTKDIFSVVASDPSYKIFTEGLELTGIKDTLQLISFPYGKTIARTRFTILAVADTIYHRYGIYNTGDLIKWCGANPDSLTYLNNPFYRYMEYHCLSGSYYLSDLNTGLCPVLSADNNIMFTIDTDYKLNLDNETKKYTGFIIPASNTPAKNGALHAINNILPVTEPEPTKVIFETTDFFRSEAGRLLWQILLEIF
ncbi:MAG: fasciclin domain-containing protein [Draconibacterium sp.]|nr:fasciclin domain-containing protein [Draconibacterium sp.]